MRRLLACVVAAVAGCSFVVPVSAAPGCLDGTAPWRWRAVGVPVAGPVLGLEQFDEDSCRLLAATPGALWLSVDGGATWALRQRTSADPVRVFAERLGARRAVVALAGGGALVTRDGGATFQAPAGLPPYADVLAAGAGQTFGTVGASDRVLLAVRPLTPAGPSLWASTDGGETFESRVTAGIWGDTQTAYPDIQPVGVYVDEARDMEFAVSASSATASPGADRVWRRLPGELTWRSDTTGGSSPAQVRDLAMVPAPEPYFAWFWAATGRGLFRADSRRNGGGGPLFHHAAFGGSSDSPSAVTAVRALAEDRDRVAVVVDGAMLLYSWRTRAASSLDAGLPSGCGPSALRASVMTPTSFLVRCASDGRVYRLVTSTSVPSRADPPRRPANPPPPSSGLARTPLRPLATIEVAAPGSSYEGRQLAFDGDTLLYATPSALRGIRTTPPHSDAVAPLTGDLSGVTYSYDRRRHLLYLFGREWDPIVGGGGDEGRNSGEPEMAVASLDLRTGRRTRLFVYACDRTCRWGYDLTRDDFWVGSLLGRTLSFVNREGRQYGACSYDGYGNPYQPWQNSAKPDGARAIVALGDGTALVDWADGTTVARVDRSCRTLGVYSHPATLNSDTDSLACDSATFSVPAVWLRLGGTTVAAFESPAGMCGSPTRLALVPGAPVRLGSSVPVCARLTLPSGRVLAGEPVTLFGAGGAVLGAARTSVSGVACRPYRPGSAGVLPVSARYGGSGLVYDPSRASGSMSVLGLVPGVPRVSRPAPPAAVVAVVPPGVAAPAAPVQPVPQTQPQPQSQGQTQSQAQSQGQSQPQPQSGVAAAHEREPQLQLAYADRVDEELAMSARPRSDDPAAVVALAAAMLAAGATGVAMSRRSAPACRRI